MMCMHTNISVIQVIVGLVFNTYIHRAQNNAGRHFPTHFSI